MKYGLFFHPDMGHYNSASQNLFTVSHMLAAQKLKVSEGCTL